MMKRQKLIHNFLISLKTLPFNNNFKLKIIIIINLYILKKIIYGFILDHSHISQPKKLSNKYSAYKIWKSKYSLSKTRLS